MAGLNLQLIVILLSYIEHVRDRERLLAEDEVALMLGVSVRQMLRYRTDKHIAYVKLGGTKVGYRREDVEAFINEQRIPARQRRALKLVRDAA